MIKVGSQVRSVDGTILGEVVAQSKNKAISFVKLASWVTLENVGADRVVGVATSILTEIPEKGVENWEKQKKADF